MRKILTLLIVGVLVWYGWSHYRSVSDVSLSTDIPTANPVALSRRAGAATPIPAVPGNSYACDGRTHCSQMTSCDEAKYFLRNCPGTKMDGNNDGEPCESQWCGNAR
jgi:hypothetical protein